MISFRAKRRVELPDHIEISIDGRPVEVRLRRHHLARRYTLRLGRVGGEPVVTVPPGGSLAAAAHFVAQHTGWLRARLSAAPAITPFIDGATIPLRGVPHCIIHRPGVRGTVVREPDPEPPRLVVAGAAEHLARRLTDWLKAEARRDLEAAVFRHAAALEVRPTVIRLRDPVGRWGSCSAKGSLSFSWRLILAPPLVLEYLAAHEVAHLRELNHGPRFWRLTKQLCPRMDEAEAWLKRHGRSLHAYGREASFETRAA